MGGIVPQLVLILVLVILNAVFAGSELALVSLRDGQLQRLEQHSEAGRTLARLAKQPNQFLATIQIGITLAGFLASAAAAVSLADPLVEPLGFLGNAAKPVSIVVVTLILSYITLVFGELVPKRIAMQRAERWGLAVARPLSALSRLTRPVVWLLSKSTDLAVRVLGGDPSLQREDVTQEELRDLVAAQTSFSEQQRKIIDGAFEIAERTLSEVLIPRGQVFVIDADEPADTALRDLIESGHSRAPVAPRRNLDDVAGVVHLRQLVDALGTAVGEISQNVPVFPETAPVLETLRSLQVARSQLAIVVNEHGGAEGIVTVEDLVEELVGEIYDEADRDILTIRQLPDGSMSLPGRFPVHDLRDIGMYVPEGDYSTIAGLVLDRLGFIPDQPGDVVEVDGWRIEVIDVHRRAITEVIVTHVPVTEDSEPPTD